MFYSGASLTIRPTDRFSVQKFESLIQFKYLRSLAEPGEAVGLLAAQVCQSSILHYIMYQCVSL